MIAYGENLDLKIGFGSSGQADNKPCAYHNPIFVDTNGDGFVPNGDTLGFALPTSKISVAQVKEKLERAGLPIE